jgi:hypothetical protein
MCSAQVKADELRQIKEIWSPGAPIDICKTCEDMLNQELNLARRDMADRVKSFVAKNMKNPPKYKPLNTWIRKLLEKKLGEITLLP